MITQRVFSTLIKSMWVICCVCDIASSVNQVNVHPYFTDIVFHCGIITNNMMINKTMTTESFVKASAMFGSDNNLTVQVEMYDIRPESSKSVLKSSSIIHGSVKRHTIFHLNFGKCFLGFKNSRCMTFFVGTILESMEKRTQDTFAITKYLNKVKSLLYAGKKLTRFFIEVGIDGTFLLISHRSISFLCVMGMSNRMCALVTSGNNIVVNNNFIDLLNPMMYLGMRFSIDIVQDVSLFIESGFKLLNDREYIVEAPKRHTLKLVKQYVPLSAGINICCCGI